MQDDQRPRLQDRDYQELIERRVHDAIRFENEKLRRFWIGIAVGILGPTVALLVWYLGTVVYQQEFRIVPIVQQYEETPFVDSLATPFSEAERLTITGRAFGSEGAEGGGVELFYRGDLGDTRTIVLEGEQIQQWTENEIIVTTTPAQRAALLSDAGNARDFNALTPYIRVVTADGRRSNLW